MVVYTILFIIWFYCKLWGICNRENNKNVNEEIHTASTKTNRNILKRNLKSNFNNVYDYAEQMLQINDKNFIDKLIENGNQKLDSSNVNQFLDLALEFWNKKRMNIEPKINRNF